MQFAADGTGGNGVPLTFPASTPLAPGGGGEATGEGGGGDATGEGGGGEATGEGGGGEDTGEGGGGEDTGDGGGGEDTGDGGGGWGEGELGGGGEGHNPQVCLQLDLWRQNRVMFCRHEFAASKVLSN